MPLVKSGEIVADRFQRILDDAAIPAGGDVLVPAERFLADPEAFAARQGETGVIWPNDRDIDELAPHLGKLAIVALVFPKFQVVFPKFQDGRAYSQARILRERLGFRGELRATGQVLRDQFVFMLRAGFDALEVKKDADASVFGAVLKRYSVFYQPTGDGRLTAFRKRLQSFAAREPALKSASR
jgi:uncharacterized protein (DUF934 family)